MASLSARLPALALGALALGLLMTLALPSEPLFHGNQNTKYLHGMAAADFGYLSEDWLANTRNGLPVFTSLVTLVMQAGEPRVFYALHAMAFIALAWALLAWHRRIAADTGLDPTLFWPVALTLGLLLSNHGTAKLFHGVATQYLVDRVFEPANFGVLMLAGALAWSAGRYWLGTATLLAAAAFHAGYVLPSAVLLVAAALAFLPVSGTAGRPTALGAFAFGLLGLAGNAWLLANAFPATTPELAAEAARILTDVRIPEHSHVGHWFDIDALAKLVLVGIAIVLVRHQTLGRFLAITLAITVGLTLLTLAPGMAELRLIAPWRTSVALMPIANMVVITFAVAWAMRRLRHRGPNAVRLTTAGVVVAAMGLGSIELIRKAPGYLNPPEPAYFAWVRGMAEPGLVFLTPLATRDFRLETGVPQYVSFQSHPYQDTEVVEWHRRVTNARAIQDAPEDACALLAAEHERAGVTHVVWPRERVTAAPCPELAEVYADERVMVFAWRLSATTSAP